MKFVHGLALALATILWAGPVVAQPPHPHPPPLFHHPGPPPWHGGNWHHGWHDGRLGWWWGVNGLWYGYPHAVYPYPHYVSPVVIQTAPQPAVAVQPQTAGAPPPAAPATQNWYYCEESTSYYPYANTCPGGWKTVPATPQGTPQ
jgi:hypothetical protein